MSAETTTPSAPSASTPSTAVRRRLLRRETRSSRTGAVVIVSVVLLLFLFWVLFETALSVTGSDPLLITPRDALGWITQAPSMASDPALVAVGLCVLVLGLLLLWTAVAPGRRSKYPLADERSAVVVDYDVVTSALTRTAQHAGNLAAEQVHCIATPRRIDVRLHPTSGVPIDIDTVQGALATELDRYEFIRAPQLSVVVAPRGAVGV